MTEMSDMRYLRTKTVQTSQQTEADMVVPIEKRKLNRRVPRILAIGLLVLSLCVSSPAAMNAAPDAGSVMHVVGKGETLWSIGHRYDVSVDQLIRLNELSEPDRLVIGQKL